MKNRTFKIKWNEKKEYLFFTNQNEKWNMKNEKPNILSPTKMKEIWEKEENYFRSHLLKVVK